MEIRLVHQAIKDIACDTLIVGMARNAKSQPGNGAVFFSATREVDRLLDGLLTEMFAQGEFKAKFGEIAQVYTHGKLAARRVFIVGLGNEEQLSQVHTFRRASGLALRFAQNKGAQKVVLALESSEATLKSEEVLAATVEGALLGTYHFRKYLNTQSNDPAIESILFWTPQARQSGLQEALKRAIIIAEATNFARDLVNEPASVMTPTELANQAVLMAKHFGLDYTVLNRSQMQELGMGGILGVAQGSTQAPTFTILRYQGAPESTRKTIALVGKGVTFDTGGISIKPPLGMDAMKGDMAGGAAVIGAMQVIAALKPAVNVIGLIPSAENMTDGGAYRPGDILRLMNGKTVEIVNTDAEGRLLLGDALSYAVKEGCSPIIDIATLTGGSAVALGSKYSSLFSNKETLRDDLLRAGIRAGEKFWPMPLDDVYLEFIESSVADVKQSGGRMASAITAAKFLEHFVDDADWAHLDIAGLEFNESKSSYIAAGASGMGVRTLAAFVLQQAAGKN